MIEKQNIKEKKSSKSKILKDIDRIRNNNIIYRQIATRNKSKDNFNNKYKHLKIFTINLFEDF